MKLMQSQRRKEKFDFLCCKICSIYQLSDLFKNYENVFHYIALHLFTLIRGGGNRTISIYILTKNGNVNNFIINCTAILCLLLYVLFFVANF